MIHYLSHMRVVLLIICFTGCQITFGQEQVFFDLLGIVKKNHKQPQLLSDRFQFTEGPATDKSGNIYFTDQPNDEIWFFNVKKKELSLFLKGTGRANGLYINANGNIVACADENNEIVEIDRRGKRSILLSSVAGNRLNGPNDLWIAPGGGIYFTDPFYKRDYWKHSEKEIEVEGVYYLAPHSDEPVLVSADLKKPNGITGTNDDRTLYVADIGDSKTYRFNINADGTLNKKELLINQGSDGITLDKKGNLYLTGKG